MTTPSRGLAPETSNAFPLSAAQGPQLQTSTLPVVVTATGTTLPRLCDCGGAIHGNGDECGRCLLNNAIARGDINWLRFTDAMDMARRWENRAAVKPASWVGSFMALDAEVGVWCERAAVLAVLLGERIGEDDYQQTNEIPYAAVRSAYLSSRINHSVRGHVDWLLRPEALARRSGS